MLGSREACILDTYLLLTITLCALVTIVSKQGCMYLPTLSIHTNYKYVYYTNTYPMCTHMALHYSNAT